MPQHHREVGAQVKEITNAVPHLIAYFDKDYRYQFANSAYGKWYCCASSEVIGKNVFDIIDPQAAGTIRKHLDIALSGQETTFETELQFPSGKRFIHATYTPDIDTDGQVKGIFAVVANITNESYARRQLQVSEEQFRAIFNTAAVGIAQSDTDTRKFIKVNKKFCEITGYSEQELLQLDVNLLTHPEDIERDQSAYAALVRGERSVYQSEKRYVRKDGQTVWVLVSATVSESSEAGLKQTVAIVQDITTRKNAEATLKRSEERLALALSAGRVGFWDWDLKTNQVVWNSQLRADGDLGTEKTSGDLEEVFKNIHPDDLPLIKKAIEESKQARGAYQVECRVGGHNSGPTVWLQCNGQWQMDQNNQPVRLTGTTLNITDSKNAEIILKEREEQFRLITETIPQGIWRSNPDGTADYFSQRFLDIVGYRLEDLLGWGWTHMIHPEDRNKFLEEWERCRLSEEPVSIEFRFRLRSGRYQWFLSLGNPFRDREGHITKYYGTWTDIHEIKLARSAAERASAAKNTFLANMSHEIRTPMTAVLGFTEILRDPCLRERDREDAVSRIEKSGRALLRLIDDILDISKIEAGKLSIEKIRFSPLELVSEVTSLLRLQAEQKGVRLKTFFDGAVPDIAYTDPVRLRQILTNLIGNSVKFTSEGYVEVKVSTEDKDILTFDVFDTGIGISACDQAKLFQPFAQADGSITRKFGGTGLGLILSKKLAEQLGGDLKLISSRKGKGSHFKVHLQAGPFATTASQSPISLGTQSQSSPIKFDDLILKGVRILLAEDVPDNQVLLRRYLEGAGARVELADNGAEAVSKATRRHYDVVLMDVQMPYVDGIQATKKLRAEGYERPILALTAHAMPEEVTRSINAGCNEHLTKPISKVKLIQAIVGYLEVEKIRQSMTLH